MHKPAIIESRRLSLGGKRPACHYRNSKQESCNGTMSRASSCCAVLCCCCTVGEM